MKTKIKVNDGSQLPYEAPFSRFARDFLSFAIRVLGANIKPLPVGVLIVPDDDWCSRLEHIIEPSQGLRNWKEAKAAVFYMPSTLEDRLRVAEEIQRVRPGEYDRFVDYCALVLVRRPELVGDGVQGIMDIYYGMVGSCIRLVLLAVAKSRGVGIVVDYEAPALKMLNAFFNTMTPDEFATRYAPAVP